MDYASTGTIRPCPSPVMNRGSWVTVAAMGLNREDRAMVYPIVASRHALWDNLLWQIPVLSMTAQAFLFSISLGPGSTSVARLIACSLSILTLFLSATSMSRQRQGSLTDSKWLAKQEKDWPKKDKQFGVEWKIRRDNETLDAGWQGRVVPRIAMFKTWIVAFVIFALADLLIMALAIWWPDLLDGS